MMTPGFIARAFLIQQREVLRVVREEAAARACAATPTCVRFGPIDAHRHRVAGDRVAADAAEREQPAGRAPRRPASGVVDRRGRPASACTARRARRHLLAREHVAGRAAPARAGAAAAAPRRRRLPGVAAAARSRPATSSATLAARGGVGRASRARAGLRRRRARGRRARPAPARPRAARRPSRRTRRPSAGARAQLSNCVRRHRVRAELHVRVRRAAVLGAVPVPHAASPSAESGVNQR